MSTKDDTAVIEDGAGTMRVVPWRQAGTPVHAKTIAEAMSQAGLDFEVELRPLFIEHEGEKIIVPERFGTVRKDTGDVLGTVKSRYHVLQNVEAFNFADGLVELGGLEFLAGGTRHGNSEVWMTGKLPTDIVVAGTDIHELHIVITHGHNGGRAVQAMVTPVCMRCMNAHGVATRSAVSKFSVQHRSGMKERMKEASEILGLTDTYVEEFKKIADQLASTEMSLKQFENFTEKLEQDRATDEARVTHVQGLKQTWENSPNLGEFKGTRWGAFNAVTEYYDWRRPVRTPEARLNSVWGGISTRRMNQAAELLLQTR